jgi:hypothetical protein
LKTPFIKFQRSQYIAISQFYLPAVVEKRTTFSKERKNHFALTSTPIQTMMYEFIYARISKIYMKIRMRCFYSECIKIVYFSLWNSPVTEKKLRGDENGEGNSTRSNSGMREEAESFRKCEFELLKCENIMRFFH